MAETKKHHSIYCPQRIPKVQKQRSFNIINKVGVSVSYNEVQKTRNDLARFTYFRSKNEGVPISSHFSKDEFTIGALDNFDHSDR